jgi:hypothetical protein
MRNLLQALFACGVVLLLASCNQKVRDGRVIFGAIVDSNGKAIANHDFSIKVTKQSGIMPNRITRWESFKFTTDANGFFSVSYNSQKSAYVQITAYTPGSNGGDYSEGLWHADNDLPDAYSAGVIKIKL